MSDYQEQIIADYQKLIYDIYQKEKLTSLKGLNNEFLVNGRNIVEWHAVITRKGRCKYYKSFDFIQNFDDLVLCSDEIMYFIANMYLYRPYMNSPIDDGLPFAGKMLYPNYENLPAYRYSMFADVVSQKLYNYWDRIGDLIAAYFPDLLKPHQVYFPKIIDVIPVQYHNEYYFWLREFRDFDYKIINQSRKEIVHYNTIGTKFKHDHLQNSRNYKKIKSLTDDRYELVDFFKKQLHISITGFEKTVLFVETITKLSLNGV